jgi:predicted hotdog family 3-hydroxylacyl-ACP dehydratase
MLVTIQSIQNYIPQRKPMVMIDSLIAASDTEAQTELTIRKENIFLAEGRFSESGLTENIAQTAAAQLGYQSARKNISVPIGYIAAVKNLKIMKLPAEGSVITAFIKIINHVLDVTVAEGRVECNDEICCTCEIRIFVKN